MKSGDFREDLFYRLNVVPIWVPPLRERRSDVALLASAFFAGACREHGRPELALDDSAREALAARDWPGNVRQLKNVVERLAVLSIGPRVTAIDVERELGRDRVIHAPTASSAGAGGAATLGTQVDRAELTALEETLTRVQGNRTLAAKLLGVSRRTLYNKLARHGIA